MIDLQFLAKGFRKAAHRLSCVIFLKETGRLLIRLRLRLQRLRLVHYGLSQVVRVIWEVLLCHIRDLLGILGHHLELCLFEQASNRIVNALLKMIIFLLFLRRHRYMIRCSRAFSGPF